MVILADIPGIGSKTIELIESKIPPKELDFFYQQLKQLQFGKLFELNLDSKVEQQIIKHCVASYYNFSYANDLMQSPQVKKIFSEILTLLRKQFSCSANQRELIFLAPTTSTTEIARRQDIVSRAISFYSSYSSQQISEIKGLLQSKVNQRFSSSSSSSLSSPPPPSSSSSSSLSLSELVILCDEEDLYLSLKGQIPKNVTLYYLHSKDELDQFSDYDLLRYAYTENSKLICDVEGADNILAIRWKNNLFDLLPELLWQEFFSKKSVLLAVQELISNYSVPADPIQKEVLDSVISSLNQASTQIDRIGKSELEDIRSFAESLVEQQLSNQQISGSELLKLLKSPVSEHLLLCEVVDKVKDKVAKKYGGAVKMLCFETIIPQIDQEALLDYEQDHTRNAAESQFMRYRDFVNCFLSRRQLLTAANHFLERVDFLIGLAQFSVASHQPRINNHKRFSCMDLTSTLLSNKEKNVQPITYYLDRNQTILTGANSGGKTSLLNLLLETQLLAQMGLYVKGAAQVRVYDQIHFFSKSSGTVGSGAFETTLKDLAKVTCSGSANFESNVLVLLDEIESITEPGAAGKLISATLDWFNGIDGVDVVLVSHLGEVLQNLCPNARIDGIEAVSLDDSLQLVVDRNPKIGVLAKSTPQLIIQKLAMQETKNPYFQYLHKKMAGQKDIKKKELFSSRKQQIKVSAEV